MRGIMSIILFSFVFFSCADLNLPQLNPDGGDRNNDIDLHKLGQFEIGISLPDYIITWTEHEGVGPSICFMGDSRIESFPISNYWSNRHMWNIARYGSTLYGVEMRIPTVREFNPDIILISVGGNDVVWGKTVDWIGRYGAVLELINLFCSRVYVTSIIPTTKLFMFADILNPAIMSLNAQLPALCAEKGVTFIDLHELEDESGTLDARYSTDGVHLNQQGYDAFYAILSPYFD